MLPPFVSTIDHVYSNCPHLLAPILVTPAGSSDHLGLVVKKYSKVNSDHPRTFKIRNHDRIHELCYQLHINNVNELISDCKTLKEANETLKREVLYYANKIIPVKTVISKTTQKPFLSHTTKEFIKEKAKAYETFKATGDINDFETYKAMMKIVKKAIYNG